MGLFEQFPFTNFHQLNLDWIIQELKKRSENMVLSVNGETGDVILYKSENIVFPSVDSNTWRMVRVADGHTAGVMFQNGLMYVMFDNAAERVYTVDHPPTYPVTSVDGQTGAVRVFPDAATRLPDVTQDKTNIRRQIRDNGVDHIVGIEIDKDKATRMDDNHRYKIYDEGNTPDIVTSVNGDSGAVIIAIPFEDTETADILFADAASGHEWSLGRETTDGVASIQLETDSSSAAAYLRFYTDDPQVSFVKKLLTIDDIPSSSGVVSFNGQTGVVTAYGDTIPVESGAARSMKEYTDDVSSGLGYVELTNTATHNIPAGAYVVWKGILFRASSIIAIGDTLSSTNLTTVPNGGLNQLAANVDGRAYKYSSLTYYSLIDRVTISKTTTNYTYYANRSLANYPCISIQPIINGYFRQGLVIHRNHFNNVSTGKFSLTNYAGGEEVEIVLAYVSDTEISMKYNASGTYTVEIIIDGLTTSGEAPVI